MGFTPLRIGHRLVHLHHATVNPKFGTKTVLAADAWDYVEMWLKRERMSRAALLYWQQAKHFSKAHHDLPKVSSPLAAYYCFLNATKALLTVKGVAFKESHGVAGRSMGSKASLANETVTFQATGVLAALCQYCGEPAAGEKYTLKDLLYNLPYIHRAYTLTYSSQPELYYPLGSPRFVKKTGSNEAWFCADVLDRRYANKRTMEKLPEGFERDIGVTEGWVVRRSKRFEWRPGKAAQAGNMERLATYHANVRRWIVYIHGTTRLWYFKRSGLSSVIERSTATMTFAAMHRLSELARYEPMRLASHFECRHNWLLSEFITTAPAQFVDVVASEITGQDFMLPGRKS